MDRDPGMCMPSFVKIDVEGAELAVFRGAESMLTKARPVIFCEIVDDYCRRYGHGLSDVLDVLLRTDYTLNELQEDGDIVGVEADTQEPPHDFVLIPSEKRI